MHRLDKLTLKALLDASLELHADRPALSVVDGENLTYRDFGRRVAEITALLLDLGLGPGDHVGLYGENMPNWGAAYFAVTTLGAVAVPILPDFHFSAVHHILRHAECKAVFVSKRLACRLDDGEFEALRARILLDDLTLLAADERCTPIRGLVRRAAKGIERLKDKALHRHEAEAPAEPEYPEAETIVVESAPEPGTVGERFRKVLAAGRKEFEKFKEAALRAAGRGHEGPKEDDLAAVIYTSGTTGNSKGVMLTHKNIVSNALAAAEMSGLGSEDRLLSILPLSHTYECTLGLVLVVLCGTNVAYLAKPPTPTILLPALQKIRPTFMLSVPLVIEKIYRNRIQPALNRNVALRSLGRIKLVRRKLHQAAGKKLLATFGGALKCFCIGGAALAPEVESFLREAGFPFTVGYGLTETSPLVSGIMPDKARFRSCGPAMPGVEVRIAADRPGGEGEIQVRGPNVMKGYFKAPAQTAEAFTEDGWLRTGDLGVLDADGFLYIKGRLKNVILGPSGENIYPEEIESVLGEFPAVLESLVFEQGGRIVARVHLDYEYLDHKFGVRKLTESQAAEHIRRLLEELRQGVNQRVSSFSRLHKIIEQPEPFEKTPTQKIKRYLYVDAAPARG